MDDEEVVLQSADKQRQKGSLQLGYSFFFSFFLVFTLVYLRETDCILWTSIFLFRTSRIWPLSGPCFTFSRPIRYSNLGVRMRSRFTVCERKERIFWKNDSSKTSICYFTAVFTLNLRSYFTTTSAKSILSLRPTNCLISGWFSVPM